MIRLFFVLFAMPCLADTLTDIEYARIGDIALKLDLHRPGEARAPLIVYVHGGAWRAGSKSNVPIARLLDHGFAIASVDYRLSTQARFPAQIHDIKAAIRFLRAHSEELHIETGKISIIGSSAGGHLAALVGVTNGNQELEGRVGGQRAVLREKHGFARRDLRVAGGVHSNLAAISGGESRRLRVHAHCK